MNPIFSITIEDIKSLTDGQSRELVARLCRAELRKHGISQAAVTWGGDQRAKDGGVDVRVDVDPPMGIDGYIKRDRSAFQVKAEKFSAGKIPDEIAPKGILRTAIVDLANDNGAYVIVSTRDSVSASSLSARIKAMGACLSDNGLSGKVVVDFYDCRRIADWVEQHPAIANWIRYVIGKPLVGWRPYSPWAYQESDTESEYLVDDRVKVFVPNADDGSDVLSAINRLRSDLNKNASVRIVGLSGVGKTRLVQALFDKRISTELPALDAENVVYTDLSDNPTPQPNAMVEALVSSNSDCVVVIDNCGHDVHQRLTETAKRLGSKVRLVTVEYDIRDDLPEGTLCYRLEGSSDDVIKELLKRRYKVLSNSDLDKITEFSDGNARVAYALASSTETTGELAQLRDSELFNRLFVQKHAESDEILRCAEAASLLYSFDGEDVSISSEIAILALFADVSIVTYSRHIAELYRRGLIQQRGKWRAVLPHAISNRLAMRAIESLPRELLIKVLVERSSDRVARSFSRRLGYLHESKSVREIVLGWLKQGGRYGGLARLNDIDRQIFGNIAPVHQEAALEALERATLNPNFVSMSNHNRSHFARITRSLAYEPALFDQAVNILIKFAIAEPEGNNNDSTRDILKSLFNCHLSGTEAQSVQRSKVVRELILHTEEKMQKIGFLLLNAALEAWHFSSHYGFDFGARKRGYGWWPRTYDDVRKWYKPFIDIAVDFGKSQTSRGRKARVVLGESVRALWVGAGLSDEISAAGKELLPIDGWPEGWLGTRSVLQWDKDTISKESLQELRNLEQLLAPRELKAKIGAKVLARGSFTDFFDEDGDDAEDPSVRYRRAEQEVEVLGKAAAFEYDLLSEILPELLNNSTNGKVYNFGFGVGQEIHNALRLLVQARHVVGNAEVGTVSLIFLRGFISGWYKAKPEEVSDFLDEAYADEVWGNWFPELQLRVDLDDAGYDRLLKSLELGKTPIWQYKYLGCGRVTDSLKVEQVFALVDRIASKSEGGLEVAIDILSMVIHCANEKDDAYRKKLAVTCIPFLENLDWSKIQNDHGRMDYNLTSLLEFGLAACTSEENVSKILHNLVGYELAESRIYSYGVGKLLAPFFKHYPRQSLDAVYVADEDGEFQTALRIVSRLDNDRQETAVRQVPLETLIKWCDISPKDRYIFAAQTCRLFEKTSSNVGDSPSGLVLSDVALSVLTNALDQQAVLHIFIDRFHPSGWTGSLAAILRERIPLLAKLNPAEDEKLKVEIILAEESLRKQIAEEEVREEARERQQTGSFE